MNQVASVENIEDQDNHVATTATTTVTTSSTELEPISDVTQNQARLAQKHTAELKWQQKFEQLCSYLSANDNVFPKTNSTAAAPISSVAINSPNTTSESYDTIDDDSKSLIAWIDNQRRYAARWEAGLTSPMTPERMHALNGINFFDLYESKWEERWNKHFELLKSHIDTYGNTHGISNIIQQVASSPSLLQSPHPTAPKLSEKLIMWCRNQRIEYGKFERGEKSTMNRTRIDKLESINFSWTESSSAADVTFEEKIRQLRDFLNIHGHLKVPKSYKANPSLGRWVARMREQFRLHNASKPSRLTLSKIQRLEEMGFEWTSTLKHAPNANWMTMYNQMIEYKKEIGDTNVPRNYKLNQALGVWTRNQRAQYMLKKRGKRSPMTEDRIRRLEAIGFKWKLRTQAVKPRMKREVEGGVAATSTQITSSMNLMKSDLPTLANDTSMNGNALMETLQDMDHIDETRANSARTSNNKSIDTPDTLMKVEEENNQSPDINESQSGEVAAVEV